MITLLGRFRLGRGLANCGEKCLGHGVAQVLGLPNLERGQDRLSLLHARQRHEEMAAPITGMLGDGALEECDGISEVSLERSELRQTLQRLNVARFAVEYGDEEP